MNKGPVLVVDDDALVREALGQSLELAGFSPILAGSFIVAKDHIHDGFEGVILSDIRMPGRDGLFLLDHTRAIDPELPVILLTGEGDIPMAVGAIHRGAFDFLEKPCANETLIEAVSRAMRERALVIENRQLRNRLRAGDAAARRIFGVSDKVEAMRAQIRKIAPVEDPVLIQGAPGSGIAKVAEVIHLLSPRSTGPFSRLAGVALGPRALDEALREAGSGTLYIEECGAMSPETQLALLGVIDRGTGVRIVAGTTQSLDAGHGQAQILPDLFYRLEALHVRIPSLKERPEDIPVIFRAYVRQASEQSNTPAPPVTPEVIAGLMAQEWPGNTRALMNAATRFVLGLDAVDDGTGFGLAEKMAQVERMLLVEALQRQNGNASAAAEQLKLPRKTFYDKLARHRIRAEDFR